MEKKALVACLFVSVCFQVCFISERGSEACLLLEKFWLGAFGLSDVEEL